MALAHLELVDDGSEHVELLGDIGTSAFYEYRVGSWAGAGELSADAWTSPLVRVETDPFGHGFAIRIPSTRVPRGRAGVQLVSYRDGARNGPAVSPIVPVFHVGSGVSSAYTRNVAFSFRERRPSRAFSAAASVPVAPAAGLVPVVESPIAVRGGSRLVFSADHDLRVRFRLESGDAIERAIVEWTLGTAAGSERLSGATPDRIELTVPREKLAALPRERDVELVAHMRWPDARGVRTAGARLTLRLAAGCFVTAIDGQGERAIGLFDPARDRAYWNRIFMGPHEGAGRAVRWKAELDCRYYVRGPLAADANGRIETRLQLAPADPDDLTYHMTGAFKSGIELAAEPLNALVSVLEPGSPKLEARELAALVAAIDGTDAAQATDRVELSGSASTHLVIWALPIFEMRRVIVRRIDEVGESGQVVRSTPQERRFPFASAIRFVSLRSTATNARPARDGLLFEGYDVVGDRTVPLAPVSLVQGAAA